MEGYGSLERNLIVAGLFLLFSFLTFAAEPVQDGENEKAKNVILLIADGCGVNHIGAADLWEFGKLGMQAYESFPFKAFMSTYSADGTGYDPDKAWSNFNYVKKNWTDSAASATAMSTGFKTYNGAIGVDVNKQPLVNVSQGAEQLGKATGVVSSVMFSHATPAGFVAHNESRNNYGEIAREMIESSAVEVIMGTGHPLYNDNGDYGYNWDTDGDGIPDKHQYELVGGIETWAKLVGKQAGANVDADHNGVFDDHWTLIEKLDEFRELATGSTPKRVVGVPCVHSTLQCGRDGDEKALPFEVPLTQTVPSLAEMTEAALNVLDDDPDGFFLMVEGGAVDWAAHEHAAGRMIEEEIAFNHAVDAAIAWVRTNSSFDETLIIVTGDHETGYLTREKWNTGDIPWSHHPLRNTGPGTLPNMRWNSKKHTNSLIPIFASGPGEVRLEKFFDGRDPYFGDYLDNTAVAKTIFLVMY
ncbi:MAG: alkaline phosphatase [Planctomycetota bacterium]|jgi:alkaline phosphatase